MMGDNRDNSTDSRVLERGRLRAFGKYRRPRADDLSSRSRKARIRGNSGPGPQACAGTGFFRWCDEPAKIIPTSARTKNRAQLQGQEFARAGAHACERGRARQGQDQLPAARISRRPCAWPRDLASFWCASFRARRKASVAAAFRLSCEWRLAPRSALELDLGAYIYFGANEAKSGGRKKQHHRAMCAKG